MPKHKYYKLKTIEFPQATQHRTTCVTRKWLVKRVVRTHIKQQGNFHPTIPLSTQRSPCLILLYNFNNMHTHGTQNLKEPVSTKTIQFTLTF